VIQNAWRAIKLSKQKNKLLNKHKEEAAIKIQKVVRSFLCRKMLDRKDKEKIKANEEFFADLREKHFLPSVRKVIHWWRQRIMTFRKKRKEAVY